MAIVNSAPSFTEQHLVANGASNLLRDVFDERGMHARAAFGVAQIPFGAWVEIERVAEADCASLRPRTPGGLSHSRKPLIDFEYG